MNILFKIIISSLAVLLTAYLLSGIEVQNYMAALYVAVVLAFLNGFLRPIMVFLTIPITISTLGLFLLVINAFIIILTGRFVDGFEVKGVWWALIFSLVLSVITSIMERIGARKRSER